MAVSLVALTLMIACASALHPSMRAVQNEQRGPQQTMAICMTGAARTIVDSDVQDGFNSHVRNGHYARGLADALPDLYMYVRVGDSPGPRGYMADTNLSAIQHALEVLKPTASKIDETAGKYRPTATFGELGVDANCFDNHFMSDPENVARVMNMFEGWFTCQQMIKKQEATSGKQYDLVMFTRPDLLWKRDIPVSWFSPQKGVFGIDWWSMMPRIIAEDVANMLPEVFLSKDPEHPCCHQKSPEFMVKCKAHSACAEHDDIKCYIVGRGEALAERIKRPDGREECTHWNGPDPVEFKDMELLEPESWGYDC